MSEIVLRHSLRCLHCGDELESTWGGDFKWCSCGACGIDGGRELLRRQLGERGVDHVDTSITAHVVVEPARTWATESALEHAAQVLAERYPSERIEILEAFDIAWSGWEFDYQGALITHDGVPELVIVDETGAGDRPVPMRLREQIAEYGRLTDATERVLGRYRAMGGVLDYDLRAVDGSLWRLRQRDGESDADYVERRRQHAAEAATLKTYPLDWSDYVQIAPATPNGYLLGRLDDLVAVARTLPEDELQAVVDYLQGALDAVVPEPMPDDVAEAVETEVAPPLVVDRLQQLADAPGGRIVLDVEGLTPEELELIADSEIRPELQWNSDGEPPDYVPIIDGPLDTEQQIETEAVAATRYLRIVEIAEKMTGVLGDVAALEAVLEIARDYKRRSGE